MSALGLGCAKTADIDEPCRHFESCSLKGVLVQWPLLRDFSDQLSRSRVEARLLLFFG